MNFILPSTPHRVVVIICMPTFKLKPSCVPYLTICRSSKKKGLVFSILSVSKEYLVMENRNLSTAEQSHMPSTSSATDPEPVQQPDADKERTESAEGDQMFADHIYEEIEIA